MRKYRCLCCGYKTLDTRAEFDICPVCFWEDEVYLNFSTTPISSIYTEKNPTIDELLDMESGANHGLTLRQAQENYNSFGACHMEMLAHVRPSREDEN